MQIPIGETSAFVTLEHALRLNGIVDTPRYFMAKPNPLGGFVVPRADTAIDVEAIAPSKIAVSIDVSRVFDDPKVVRESLDCDAITIVPADYDVLPKGFSLDGPRVGMSGVASLSLVPGGQPVAQIRRSPSAEIVVGKIHGSSRQIVFDATSFVAFGYTPSANVDMRATTALGGIGRLGRRGLMQYGASRPRHCPHEVTVRVEIGGERAVVGELMTEARFFPDDSESQKGAFGPEFQAIRVTASYVELVEDAHLLVARSDIADCPR